jgi:hypothetical protein
MSPVRSVTHVFGLDICVVGALGGIRTPDPQIRSLMVAVQTR